MRIVTWGMLAALVLLASYPSEGANPRVGKGYSGQNASFPIDRRGSSGGIEKDIPPPAGNFAGAEQALERGGNEATLRTFLPLAEAGDVKAQFKLGVMYDRGENVPQHFAEAVKWYRAAAEQGHAEAQLALGRYILGIEKAALDLCELTFVFSAKDEFRSNLRKNRNKENLIEAHKWFNLAASRPGVSKKTRGKAVCMRDLMTRSMDWNEVSLAQKRAREWRPKK
ncbi:MAG: tetratricopeptide repeat protein [Nitrospinae bacterium]|nr:tetratricopeptide repeat protein [Nitrospinota bacterium]